MTGTQVEYVGFAVTETAREYTLRVRSARETHDFRLVIPILAFDERRVRYQDAPEICFLRLQRELDDAEGSLPVRHLTISDSELEEYREAHSKKPPRLRPTPP
jgi:hypothetical protein